MKFLQILLAALITFHVSSAEARTSENDYAEQDGGYLVYSVGTIRIGMDFAFPYSRTALLDGSPVDDWKGVIEPKLGGMWTLKIKKPDFDGRESGHVIIRRLPPGQYAITNFAFGGQVPGIGSFDWSAVKPFEIPFSIKSGQATYIGSYMRSPSFGMSLQTLLGTAGFFVVSDRSVRDLPIALRKNAALPVAKIEVINVDTIGNPALRSREPD